MKRNDVKLEEFYRWNFNEHFKLIKKKFSKADLYRICKVFGCVRMLSIRVKETFLSIEKIGTVMFKVQVNKVIIKVRFFFQFY